MTPDILREKAFAPRPRKIVAEVWDRYLMQVPGTKPASRHTTVARAEARAHTLNAGCPADQDPRPYLVLALWDGVFLPLVSWAGVIKTKSDPDWVFNGQRFGTANEAQLAVRDLYTRWTAVTETAVAPTSDPVTYRWDNLRGRAIYLDAPDPEPAEKPELVEEPAAPVPVPAPHQDAPPALSAVEQALRASGVMVESPLDPTEATRRVLVATINADPGSREALEAKYGRVWSTDELTEDFTVLGFGAPYVVVRRKASHVKGSLMFQHSPRFYYSFREDN